MNGSNPTTSTGSTGWRVCGRTHTVQCGAVMRIVDVRLHTGECFLLIVLQRMAENLGVKNPNKGIFLITGLQIQNESTKKASAAAAKRAGRNTGGRHQNCLHLPSRPYEAVDAVRTSAMRATVTEKNKQKNDNNTSKNSVSTKRDS